MQDLKLIYSLAKQKARKHLPRSHDIWLKDVVQEIVVAAWEAQSTGKRKINYDWQAVRAVRKIMGTSGSGPRPARPRYHNCLPTQSPPREPAISLVVTRLRKLIPGLSRMHLAGLAYAAGYASGVEVAREYGLTKAAVSMGCSELIEKIDGSMK